MQSIYNFFFFKSKPHGVSDNLTVLYWATNHGDTEPHVVHEMQVGHASLHYVEFSGLGPVYQENFCLCVQLL